MTSEDFQISEISKNEEKDDEFDVLNSAIKLITDYTNKAKNKKGFYYTETLKLINYEDIKDFFFCKSCNNSFLFFIESKDLINLETISYSCKCEKKIQQIIQIKDLDILKVNLNDIKNKLICKSCGNKYSLFCERHSDSICQSCSLGIHKNENLNKFDTLSIFNDINYLIYFAINEKNQKEINEAKNSYKIVIYTN